MLLIHVQDWFSGQLKLVVLELSPSMPSPTVQVTTDGGAISTMPTASFNDDLDLIELVHALHTVWH